MSVEDFYKWCVENEKNDYTLKCFGITNFGDVSYSTELRCEYIHDDTDNKTIIFFAED